jgi:hypothetical protein
MSVVSAQSGRKLSLKPGSSVTGPPAPRRVSTQFPLGSVEAEPDRNRKGTPRDVSAGSSDSEGTVLEPQSGRLCDAGIPYVEETWRPPREDLGSTERTGARTPGS